MQVMFTAESRIMFYNEGAVIVVGGLHMEFNTNLFRTPTDEWTSSVGLRNKFVLNSIFAHIE